MTKKFKFIVKTTKEFTYDEKGFVTKEVVTEESYEEEVNKGGSEITSGTITATDIKPDVYIKATGIPSTALYETNCYDPKFLITNNGGLEMTGDLKLNAKSVSEVANEVKAILEKDLKNEVKLKSKIIGKR
jgi:hypothetical protein